MAEVSFQARRPSGQPAILLISSLLPPHLQAAGAKGKRFAMPSTRIMMHQPAGGAMGSADEVNIQASELNRTMKVACECFSWLPCHYMISTSRI